MKEKQLSNQTDQEIIVDYIYGELSLEQQRLVEERSAKDLSFKNLLTNQQKLEQLEALKMTPQTSEQQLEAVRRKLRQNLQASQQKKLNRKSSLVNRLLQYWPQQVSVRAQLASMLFTFTLGLLSAGSGLFELNFLSSDGESKQRLVVDSQQAELTPLNLIAADDYQIVDLQLSQLASSSNEIKVKYSLASQTVVNGQVSNESILNLLTTSIKYEVSDSTRLEIIDILKNYTEKQKVREALSYSLLNDLNPGVRIAAAESLASLSADVNIRNVLRLALQSDINSGIRVQAFQALLMHLEDPETLRTLIDFAAKDSNQYIRSRTQKLLKQRKLQV